MVLIKYRDRTSGPDPMTREKNPKLERATESFFTTRNFNKTYSRIDDTYRMRSVRPHARALSLPKP